MYGVYKWIWPTLLFCTLMHSSLHHTSSHLITPHHTSSHLIIPLSRLTRFTKKGLQSRSATDSLLIKRNSSHLSHSSHPSHSFARSCTPPPLTSCTPPCSHIPTCTVITQAALFMPIEAQACMPGVGALIPRVGQNRIYTPYMTVYLVISLPKLPYIHRIYMVLANPTHTT
jgi:hypothetical protein